MEITPKAIANQIAGNLTYKSKRQPGAILLNGGWGVGKTHLWREEILPILKDQKQLCVYVSLFGVKSADDFKSKLTTALVGNKGVEENQWMEQFVKSLPGAFMTAVSGIAKEKLGLDASEIMKSFNMKLDPLQLFPQEVVVCLDDMERCRLDVEETLGVISYLIEHKAARVLVIANEDYLSGESAPDEVNRETYKKFKEKVVWQSVSFQIPLDEVFASFVEEFAITNKSRIKESKPLILETLKAGGCKNLRTLQKVIRLLDYVYTVGGGHLEERNGRFLIALTEEDARNGLKPDLSIYCKTYSPIFEESKNKKPEDLKPDEKIGRDFYLRYFKDQFNIGFSLALFDYVRTGVLDEDMLRDEIGPEDAKLGPGARLCKEFLTGNWRYGTDQEIQGFAERMEQFLREDGKAKPNVLIRLFGACLRVRGFIDQTVSTDLEEIARGRLREAVASARADDKPKGLPEFVDEEDMQLIEPLVSFLREEQKRAHGTNAKTDAIDALKSGHLPDILAMPLTQYPWVLTVLTDSDLLNVVDGLFETQPFVHGNFYNEAIKRVLEAKDKAGPLKVFRDRLEKLLNASTQIGVSKRLQLLLNMIEINQPRAESASAAQLLT